MPLSSSSLTKVLQEEWVAICSGLLGGARYGVKIRFPHALIMTLLFPRLPTLRDKARYILQQTTAHATRLAVFAATYKVLLALLKYHYQCQSQLDVSYTEIMASSPSISANLPTFCHLAKSLVSLILHGTCKSASTLSSSTALQSTVSAASAAGYPQRHYHALLAGMVSGSLVWGTYTPLNYQILLYLASRVTVGLWKLWWSSVLQSNIHERNSNDDQSTTTKARPTKISSFRQSSSLVYRFSAGLIWGLSMILFEECPQVLHPSLRKSMDEIFRRHPASSS
ncbi:hypothetical protein ACA910_001664 [Epithemia clementina (nom. ined.)]